MPRVLVSALAALGHDVTWIATEAPGITDQAVLAWAGREQRLLLTCDKDSGELAASAPLPPAGGVILLRLPLHPGPRGAEAVAQVLNGRTDWAGYFSVIEPGRIRMRPLV